MTDISEMVQCGADCPEHGYGYCWCGLQCTHTGRHEFTCEVAPEYVKELRDAQLRRKNLAEL